LNITKLVAIFRESCEADKYPVAHLIPGFLLGSVVRVEGNGKGSVFNLRYLLSFANGIDSMDGIHAIKILSLGTAIKDNLLQYNGVDDSICYKWIKGIGLRIAAQGQMLNSASALACRHISRPLEGVHCMDGN